MLLFVLSKMSLEHRIPPPIVMLLSMAMAYVISRIDPWVGVGGSKIWLNVTALSVAVCGILVAVLAVWQFRQHRTTLNPLSPDSASDLVTTGLFSLSRNPMYLGMALCITACAIRLHSPLALLGVVFFCFYITCFQIRPEERAIEALFGEQYREYCRRTRRWI